MILLCTAVKEVFMLYAYRFGDGRGPSTTSQERQKPRHEHPKPNQERLGPNC